MSDLKDKVLSRISKGKSCWNWIGYISPSGYGRLCHYTNGKTKGYQAHRLVYEIYKGKIPEGLQVDHLCRNRSCVNPQHLEAVTQRENILRGTGASARNIKKTHCPKGHKYDYVRKNGDRMCKRCHYKRAREYRKRAPEHVLKKIRKNQLDHWHKIGKYKYPDKRRKALEEIRGKA